MSSTVISLGPLGGGANHLRVVDAGEELTLPIIKATLEHRNFILGTWVKSYANTARQTTTGSTKGTAHTVPQDLYLKHEPRVAEALWDRAAVVTGEDGYTVHAWVCGEPGVLWHVYVPPQLRNKGIAAALINWACGHKYEVARAWPFNRGLPGEAIFNPYLLGKYAEKESYPGARR